MVDMDWDGLVECEFFVLYVSGGRVFEKSSLSWLRLTSMGSAFH